MPRIKVVLNKTNTQRLNKFFKWAKEHWKNIDNEKLSEYLIEEVKKEIKNLREHCSEKSIVEAWINKLESIETPDSFEDLKQVIKEKVKQAARSDLANQYTNKTFDNNIDIYFNEVKREYILHPQSESDELQFIPENRDIFIKNNLKLVVNCAKRYKGLGLPFEDLIQAGNEGLLTAFNKFKTDKSNLRNAIMDDIQNYEKETFTYDEAEDIIKNRFTYGKLLDQTLAKLPKDGFDNKDNFLNWCKEHVKAAVFASVAFKWIRSAIVFEIGKLGSIIKLPKLKSEEDDADIDDSNITETTSKKKSQKWGTIIRLDSINPYTDDNYSDGDLAIISNEEFVIENEALENVERQDAFKTVVESLLANLDNQPRQIMKKKYGIGYPYQMTINEIADSENLSINNVKKIMRDSMLILQESLSSSQKDALLEML